MKDKEMNNRFKMYFFKGFPPCEVKIVRVIKGSGQEAAPFQCLISVISIITYLQPAWRTGSRRMRR